MGHYVAAREWDLAAELLACHSAASSSRGRSAAARATGWRVPGRGRRRRRPPRLRRGVASALDGDRGGRDAGSRPVSARGGAGRCPTAPPRWSSRRSADALLCFDDLCARCGGRRALPRCRGAPVRAAVETLTAWHLYLLGRDTEAEQLARQAVGEQVHLPSAGLPLVAICRARYWHSSRCGAVTYSKAQLLTAAAVAARDGGPCAPRPTRCRCCTRAQLLTLTGDPEQAAASCRAGLDLARGWRDSSLVVPAVGLELARAYAALGDTAQAQDAIATAHRQLDGAHDPGLLPAALDAVLADPETPYRGTVELGVALLLSTREIEVLAALARVGSLREVADELFISRNTIRDPHPCAVTRSWASPPAPMLCIAAARSDC